MTQARLAFYEGAYAVELKPGTPKDFIGGGCTVKGNLVLVPHGNIQQIIGGIQFCAYSAEGRPVLFSWSYGLIWKIWDARGGTLWDSREIMEEAVC